MIPKIIHYCWFGNPEKPAEAELNIGQWKSLMPDYEFREWNESNFDFKAFPYSREAYLSGNYAFVSDVARVLALFNEGGIYLDTDVELLKPFDDYLSLKAFLGREGNYIGTAVMGSEPGAEWLSKWLDYYRRRHFINAVGHAVRRPNVRILTENILPALPQKLCPEVFPSSRFSAKDYITGEIKSNRNTVAIHHFQASWRRHKSLAERIRQIIRCLPIRYA